MCGIPPHLTLSKYLCGIAKASLGQIFTKVVKNNRGVVWNGLVLSGVQWGNERELVGNSGGDLFELFNDGELFLGEKEESVVVRWTSAIRIMKVM